METEFKVVNIVATQNTGFRINIDKVITSPYLVYTSDQYTAIKPKGATCQITIFYNGNMITVGNRSVEEARKNLEIAKKFLKKFRIKTGLKRLKK